jgi:flagellar protein FlaI
MSAGLFPLIERLREVKAPERERKDNDESEDEKDHGREGLEVPVPGEFDSELVDIEEEGEKLSEVEMTYPLIPVEPEEGENVYAWAKIEWSEEHSELIYRVIEPELDNRLENILERIQEILERSFDISLEEISADRAHEYLEEKVDQIIQEYNIALNSKEREKIDYYINRNYNGLGKLEPVMRDKEIEDISCDGSGIPVYVYHRNPKLGSLRTNVKWDSSDNLDSFVMKLAQRSGKSISVSNPLVDGSLPDGSRVQATLATDIARKGSNFTIRRFSEDPLTPIHMMDFGTEDARMLSYIWTMVERGKSGLITGTTGAGKTSQLNALSLFIEPDKKIVSIEDTPELRLPHEHWVPQVARSGFGETTEEGGEVSMDNLLKESLRMRPEYIIVGEVRGEEAYILFQQMATGHTGLSTIHADSMEKLMNRLTTNPINLSPSLIETLDFVLLVSKLRRGGSYVRRVKGIHEILGYDERQGVDSNKVFEWNPENDEYEQKNNSVMLQNIADESAIDYDKLKDDLENKQQVLKYMQKEQIKHYEDVGNIISMYYSNPENLMETIRDEISSEVEKPPE